MPLITDQYNVYIPDGSSCSVVKNADGSVNYIDYFVGQQVFRVTVAYVDANTTSYSIPTLQV